MSNRTFVIGVGMTKFEKPGTKEGDYPDWAKEAGEKALADAGIPYDDVEQAYAGYCYGDSTYGQRALYQLGLTGIPVVNVNNNCSTGSSALFLARQAVKGGLVDCALALGFEKMEPGSLGVKYTDRTNALDKHATRMFEIRDPEASPPAPQMFGNAGRDHMEKYGSNPDHYAWIGWKNHKHSVNNPYAQFQDEYSLEDIKDAKMIHDPLTKLQCSPTSDGSACAIVASERYVDEHGLWDQAIEIAGQSMVTDLTSTFAEDADCMTIVGSDMSKTAADQAYAEAGIAAEEVDVCELHDCFSANELITYEALGFAAEGEGHKLVEEEATTYGGKVVVNPSGGLISKGHPLGATGPRPVLRADLAAARRSRQAPGRRRQGRPAAQHRPRRRRRGHRLQAGRLRPAERRDEMAKERQGTRRQGRRDHRRRPRDRQGDGDGAGPQGLPRRDRRPRPGARRGDRGRTGRRHRRAARRRHRPRLLRRLPRRGRAPARPARRRHQQRRDHAGHAVRRGERGVGPPPDRHQPPRRHHRHPAGDRADDPARLRPHRQHRLAGGQGRACRGSPPTRRPSTPSSASARRSAPSCAAAASNCTA